MARYYIVGPHPDSGITEPAKLVQANTQAQAIGHVVRNRYKAEVASQQQIIDLLAAGVKAEVAGDVE